MTNPKSASSVLDKQFSRSKWSWLSTAEGRLSQAISSSFAMARTQISLFAFSSFADFIASSPSGSQTLAQISNNLTLLGGLFNPGVSVWVRNQFDFEGVGLLFGQL